MDCLAGIVLYNPDIERLKANILAIKAQVTEVLLVDNNSKNINEIKNMVDDLTIDKFNLFTLIENSTNKGIAFALNQILDYAEIKQYPIFLTLDQDSICSPGLIESYKEYYNEEIGQMTCNIIDEKTGVIDSIEWGSDKVKDVETCITSGALNNTKALCEVGGFDTSLFIDGVDIDISLKLLNNGYKVKCINYDGLSHELGNGKVINFVGKRINFSNHTPWRNYYARRNFIFIARKHYKGIKKIKMILKQIVFAFGLIVFEDNKNERIKKNLKGIIDGFMMKI